MKKEIYKCEACRKTYKKGWSDKDANKEAKDIWGVENASESNDMAIICDGCFNKRTPEDVNRMGKEFQKFLKYKPTPPKDMKKEIKFTIKKVYKIF